MKHLSIALIVVCVAAGMGTFAYSQGTNPSGTAGVVGFGSHNAAADINKLVGEEVCFPLTAKDANGNVIRNWHITGSPTTLTLMKSTANTDSSTQSWNEDPDGFSFAKILHNGVELPKISDTSWSVSETLFVDGQTQICVIHTKSDTGVYIDVTPVFPGLNQQSQSMSFGANNITNYLVAITPSTAAGDQVYQYRRYEIIVAPRDRYLNISPQTIATQFSARFPGEFVSSGPNLSNIFSGEVFINGLTNYFLASTVERELPLGQLQSIRAFSSADFNITGVTPPYEVLSHEPYNFALMHPMHDTTIVVDSAQLEIVRFLWERPNPPDPYTNINISDFSGEIGTDIVTYTWKMIDSASLSFTQQLQSNNAGADPMLFLTKSQLRSLGDQIVGVGTESWARLVVYWFVEATDGLYITKSTPPNGDPQGRPGHKLVLIQKGLGLEPISSRADVFALGQNYPNPFNPTTTIAFSIPQRSQVRLQVFDLIGNEIETLANEELLPGLYNVQFDAAALPSGTYIYRLTAGDQSLTRRMVVTK